MASTPVRFGILGLQPAFSPELAVPRVLSLPWGGPADGSGMYVQGQALGCLGVATLVNEVATLAIGGTPTGGTFTVSFNGLTTTPLAFNATLAAFQAALGIAVPEFAGNVTVTGTPGASYVVTFNNLAAAQRIGGLFGVNVGGLTGGTPTGSWARTTRGSCGLAQADVYNQSTNNSVDAFLKYDTTLSPGGSLVPNGIAFGLPGSGQPFQPTVYLEGIFRADHLVGLDANAYTLGKLTKMTGGVHVRLI